MNKDLKNELNNETSFQNWHYYSSTKEKNKKFFNQNEHRLSEDELMTRKKKYLLQQIFLNKLNQMCD